ncbi:MAG: hypothetical protein WC462_03625 [archaeon]
MQNSRAKKSSGSNPIKNEVRVVWWKVAGAVGFGVILGLIVVFYLLENTLNLNAIFQAIELVLITCALALLLDIRQLVINLSKK